MIRSFSAQRIAAGSVGSNRIPVVTRVHAAPSYAPRPFACDADQNLTAVGGTGVSPVRYTRDAENRLIEVVPAEDDPNNLTAHAMKLVFTYDYLNRRVRMVVYA